MQKSSYHRRPYDRYIPSFGWRQPRRVYIRSINLPFACPCLRPQTPSRIRRYLKNVNATTLFSSVPPLPSFPSPSSPPSGSWTDRLPELLIHQGNHDVAEQHLPSPRTLIRPNLPLCLDRQARPCPRSDICTPISRPRINTSDLLIPRLTRLLHSNTHRSKALSDIRPNPLTRIRPGDYRRSRSRIRTSTPLLRQRRGANGRHSVALVSKISQTQL